VECDRDILPLVAFRGIVILACWREFLFNLAADLFFPCDFFGRQLAITKDAFNLSRHDHGNPG